MIRVLIAGEGPNEIGQPATEWEEGERSTGGGTIEALMKKVRPTGWKIKETHRWKDISKLRPNTPGMGEERTVRGLVLRARESGCHALVFLRDSDTTATGGGTARERIIQAAMKDADKGDLNIAGGVPITMLECWLLALRGEANAHTDGDPAQSLEARHEISAKKTAAMVQLIRNANLLEASADAKSLWRWLRRVAVALNVKIPAKWPTP